MIWSSSCAYPVAGRDIDEGLTSSESIIISDRWSLRAGAHRNYRSDNLFRRANERDPRRRSDVLFGEDAMQIVDARDWSIAVRHDHIAVAQVGRLGRTSLFDRRHENSGLDREAVVAHDPA